MTKSHDLWNQANDECEKFEDKGTTGYPVNLVRRILNKIVKLPELEDFSLIIKIIPTQNISGLDLNLIIDKAISQSNLNMDYFVLNDTKYGKFSFKVSVDYEVYEDEFIESDDEIEDDLEEDVTLENRAKNVTIILNPHNGEQVRNKIDEITYLVIKSFNSMIMSISKKITFSAKFIFEFKYKKGTENSVKKMAEKINNFKNYKIYFREDIDFDRVMIILPFEEVNDSKNITQVLKTLK